MKESIRYLHNAREILRKAPREGRIYTDIKPVREACSTAYLSVLLAIDEFLLKRGVTEKELPQSVDNYRDALRKHLSVHNGKLFKEFDVLYYELHLAGYYRGFLRETDTVQSVFKVAQQFIEKLGK